MCAGELGRLLELVGRVGWDGLGWALVDASRSAQLIVVGFGLLSGK